MHTSHNIYVSQNNYRRDAAIIGLVCCLLNGEGRGNLQDCLSFVMLILVADLVAFIPGILLHICVLLIHVILKFSTDSDVVGRFWLFSSGTLFHLIYFYRGYMWLA